MFVRYYIVDGIKSYWFSWTSELADSGHLARNRGQHKGGLNARPISERGYMRRPDKCSAAYMHELKLWQDRFLQEMTASPEITERAYAEYPDWTKAPKLPKEN
jgi:hypothetical protein